MKNKNECGALIVEASIVFPVMFLAIFFMLYSANAFYQKSRIEAIIGECAMDGAAYCADPQLDYVTEGTIPTLDSLKTHPYRYFSDSGAGDVESQIKSAIEKRVKALDSGLFPNMKPESFSANVNYSFGILYATFSVDASYKIMIPIRLLGEKENVYYKITTHVEMPVTDTTDMIRNIDMVWDYMEKFGADEKFGKLSEMVENAKAWFNSW